MRRFLFAVACLCLLLTACGRSEDTAAPCPDGVRVGELIDLPDRTSVRVEEVINSLCPCNAVCVWAGELLVVLSYGELRDTVARPFDTIDEDLEEVQIFDPFVVGSYEVIITEVDDGLECAQFGDLIEQEDYCIRFEIR